MGAISRSEKDLICSKSICIQWRGTFFSLRKKIKPEAKVTNVYFHERRDPFHKRPYFLVQQLCSWPSLLPAPRPSRHRGSLTMFLVNENRNLGMGNQTWNQIGPWTRDESRGLYGSTHDTIHSLTYGCDSHLSPLDRNWRRMGSWPIVLMFQGQETIILVIIMHEQKCQDWPWCQLHLSGLDSPISIHSQVQCSKASIILLMLNDVLRQGRRSRGKCPFSLRHCALVPQWTQEYCREPILMRAVPNENAE